jgi:hypothetical protein
MVRSRKHVQSVLIVGASALHLAFVGLGASHAWPEAVGWFGSLLHLYGSASGASGSYSFFAPGVGSQLRVQLAVVDAAGRTSEEALATGVSREAELRVGNIVGGLWSDWVERDMQRAVAASLAGTVFGRRPDADTVSVRFESFDLPTMEQYREGQRGEWQSHYQAKFKHSRPDSSH